MQINKINYIKNYGSIWWLINTLSFWYDKQFIYVQERVKDMCIEMDWKQRKLQDNKTLIS